jgi:predicted nucleic acid-binding protein
MPDAHPILVLDTNVVLDWLVFADPRSAAAGAAIAGGLVHWLASAAMRHELERVLARGRLGARQPETDAALAQWDRHATMIEARAPLAQSGWRCSDPDDQKFIDLALHCGAAALLTRDRALLRLARRARAAGLAIVPAEAWAPPRPA